MASNIDDKNNWRDKYLNALDAQEAVERDFTDQLELLRKALVRVSVAADGQNEPLDQVLNQLREQLRGGVAAMNRLAIENLLGRLEKAALAFEEQRGLGVIEVREALAATIKPLQQLDLPRPLLKDLARYLELLPNRSQKVYLYPALLRQLAEIQARALAEVEQPKTSFLSRLLPGRAASPSNPKAEQALIELALQETALLKAAKAQLQNPVESAADALDIVIAQVESPLPASAAKAIPERQESASERRLKVDTIAPELAVKLTQVLVAFLNSLENETSIQDKVAAIRLRVEQGLAPEALIPTLEAVRDLVTEAYLAANQAFASYLKDVNQELLEIYALIGGAVEHSQTEQAVSRQLQADVIRQMDSLTTETLAATDLNQLKHQVQSQLGNIRHAIDTFQQANPAQSPLVQQLASLSEKIKSMEREAEKNSENLAAQRYKALHDALTNLPNREAYNQRVVSEIQRWQRYGRPLTLAIFDIDHFKAINDSYGHQAGDRVIKVIGQTIQKRLREVDFFCRYGGEEFVALLPETAGQAALVVLEKIREAIANASFNYKDQHLSITFSVGLTEFKEDDSLESVFERADRGLYTAKAEGRNCCRLV